jgi:hypothetical protein
MSSEAGKWVVGGEENWKQLSNIKSAVIVDGRENIKEQGLPRWKIGIYYSSLRCEYVRCRVRYGCGKGKV